MKDVVKYHNDLNTVVMRKWTTEEMNLLFAILAKSKEKGTETLTFNTEELKKTVGFSQKNNKIWNEAVKSCARKVINLVYFEETEKDFFAMTLFDTFQVRKEEREVVIKLSSNFDYILNRLNANFTKFELQEFTQIRSTYAKTAYRLLKQWRTVGKKEFKIDDFKRLMDMPKSYKSSEIDRAVIKPIEKELSQFFKGLKIKKVKSNKKGNPVLGYEFKWQKESSEGWIEGKYDKKNYPPKQYKAKKSTKSNIPDYVLNEQPKSKDEATAEEKAKLEALKRSMLEDEQQIDMFEDIADAELPY